MPEFRVKLRRSSTSGSIPSVSDLELGELAVNTYDGKIFTKKDDGQQSIVEVGVGTDLTWTASTRTIASSSGTNAIITNATTSDSGLMSSSDKSKLDGIQSGAQVNVGTDLSYVNSTREVQSSTGTNATLPEVVAGGVSGFMTGSDKTKLDGIATGAQVNVGTDLSYTSATRALASSTGTDVTLPLVSSGGSAGLMSGSDKTKLDSIQSNAEINVNADWNATSGDAQILNKPSIPQDLDDLSNVDTTTPTDGQVLAWDNTNSYWAPADASSGITDLSYTSSTRVISSSTGTDATLPEVTAAGDSGLMTGADKTKLDGIETGATADQTAQEILTEIKTVDGSSSGLDADLLDGVEGSSYLRSDTSDTSTGILDLNGGIRFVTTNAGGNGLSFVDNGYQTRWDGRETLTNQTVVHKFSRQGYNTGNFNAYVENWYDSANYHSIGLTTGGVLQYDSNTVWHAGNDGSGSGLDADTLDGQQGSYYLDYNNLTNTPTISSNADTLDNLDSSQFLRSDAADTATGTITFSGAASAPFRLVTTNANSSWDAVTFQATTEWGDSSSYGVLGGDGTEGVMLRRPHVVWNSTHSSADIRLGRSGGTSSGAWVNMGVKANSVGFIGYQDSNVLTWGSSNVDITNGLTVSGSTAWHAGNDGAGSGLDADTLDGQQGSYYLDYNNFTNTPSGGGGSSDLQGYEDYEALIEFGSDAAGTERRIISASLSTGTYQTIGFQIDVIDNGTNHAPTNSASNVEKSTYYVNCVRADNTTPNNPDSVTIKGPSFGDLIRARKISQGNYEVTVRNTAQWREYRINIKVIAVNGSHTITYRNGDTPSTAAASYTSSSASTNINYFQAVKADSYTANGHTVWHAGNDGSGSGLDADTVDGIQASSFLRSDADDQTTGQLTADTLLLTNDATDTARHRVAVYGSGTSSTSYGMMLWNTNGTSGDWSTMIYGPNQDNRRISFGKINDTTFTNHADVTEIAHFDLDTSAFSTTAPIYAKGSFMSSSAALQVNGFMRTGTIYLHTGTSPSSGTDKSLSHGPAGLEWDGNTIWHTGNDGSGSGLDADTLDGIDSSRIIYGGGSRRTNNSNPNSALNSGFYDIYQTNAPTATWYSYITMAHTNTANQHGHQIAGSFYSDGEIFNRHYDGTTASFGNWTRIWNAANDGAGSGLDADLLDGNDSSYYRNASNINAGTFPDRFSNTTRYNIGYIDGVGASSYDKLRVWDSSSYTIGMTSANTFGWLNDYAMTFTFNNDDDRGFLWRDTNHSASQGAMSLTTNGNLCVANVIAVGGQTTRYLREPSGNYGSIQISGSGYGNWEGFSIDGRAVFMHDGGNATGIYNDVDNEWFFYGVRNSYTRMYHNGSTCIQTVSSSEANIGGNKIWHAGNDGSGSGLSADDVDGIAGSNICTLDGDQTISGRKVFTASSSQSGSASGFLIESNSQYHLAIKGVGTSNSPLITIWEGGISSFRCQIGWSSNGYIRLDNNETNDELRIGNSLDYVQGSSTRTVWHSGNDGSGSGLDADTVDGIQGGSFLRSDASDSFSGTINGSSSFAINRQSSYTPGAGNSNTGIVLRGTGVSYFSYNGVAAYFNRNSNGDLVSWRRSGTEEGSIEINTSRVYYRTTSDYRRKTNVAPIANSIEVIKALNPSSYNWIEDNRLDHGFLAHEIQEHIPGSASGHKDEIDEEGEPVYQKVDLTTVIPFLTAALKESIARIESLEATVAALQAV